ncbi:hypothetical protein [Methanosarcina sp. UBA289]|uniref:hypothetical protein n=1 Tax=Methanosarcina sp. UBA289 TaxID=1915574 RepID=UPI0025E85B0B|nr:hypothetical protein [Methanosarcina sp. UBA289]
MFFEPVLVKYRTYLKHYYGLLRLLIIAERFTFLFLLMILFNAYEFAYFLPGMETFSKTQNYIDLYRFNIILMAVGAVIFIFFAVTCDKLLRKKREFNFISMLERNFPGLRTKLVTACDNKQNFNIVTNELFHNVHNELIDINIKKLAPRRQILRTFVIFLLFSGSIFLCITEGFSFDISPRQLTEKIPNLPDVTASGEVENETVDETEYGVEAVIIKNGEQIEMEINPSLGLGFTNRVDSETDSELNESSNSSKKGFRYSQTYTEDLPEEYEPLIKQYFEKLSS